jgi:iron-sulfur cluster assembly accessory protein
MKCPITLSPKAVEMIKVAITTENGTILRIGFKGGGCAGMTKVLEIIEESSKKDFIFEQDGVQIAIDPMSIQYLKGVTIDYIQKGLESGFTFTNLITTSSCGCGKSVAI